MNMMTVSTIKQKNTISLTLVDLAKINGGTFTPNAYSKEGYHTFGISTSYNFLEPDEFYFMGHKITYETANRIMQIGNRVLSALNPKGTKPCDCIKPEEAAFIKTFNSQLNLYFAKSYLWDGKKGQDC